MDITAFQLAQRYVGIKEVAGVSSNPIVLAMLRLDQTWPEGDDVPWCSAFANWICWHLQLPRSKDLRARSWLKVGYQPDVPMVGFDVVVLKRGQGNQPGPEVIDAPGHVGFFAGFDPSRAKVLVLGGNQSDAVNVAPFYVTDVLGYRRLHE